MHCHNVMEPATIKRINAELNRSSGAVVKKKPRCLVKNTSALVVIETSRPICLEKYQDIKQLGRIMLRVSGSTIAAGLVTQVIPKFICIISSSLPSQKKVTKFQCYQIFLPKFNFYSENREHFQPKTSLIFHLISRKNQTSLAKLHGSILVKNNISYVIKIVLEISMKVRAKVLKKKLTLY